MELEAGVYPVKSWYDALEGKSRTNYGASVGSVPLRENILNPDWKDEFHGYILLDMLKDPAGSHASMKWSKDHATAKQIEQFERMVEEGLQQGSVGVGHATVTEEAIDGKEVIDASGHAVVPGFIDTRSHNTGTDLGERMCLRDSVTTHLELEMGVYPVDEWYDHHEGKRRCNYGASVGLAPIREHMLNDGYKTVYSGFFTNATKIS
jgi:hypothetical protein